MKSYSTLIKGARLVVERCFAVKEGDSVLIIADEDHEREAKAIAGVAVSTAPIRSSPTSPTMSASAWPRWPCPWSRPRPSPPP